MAIIYFTNLGKINTTLKNSIENFFLKIYKKDRQ